jgi:hypothetical protein
VALGAHYLQAAGETGSFVEALTDETVLMDAAGFALGYGAMKVGDRLLGAVRAGSSAPAVAGGSAVRNVPQHLIGGTKPLPFNYFQLARSAGYSMGEGEAIWRTVSYHVAAGGHLHMGANLAGDVDTAGRLFSPPSTRQPGVVR